jgi:hypothetical protein
VVFWRPESPLLTTTSILSPRSASRDAAPHRIDATGRQRRFTRVPVKVDDLQTALIEADGLQRPIKASWSAVPR